MISRKKHNLLVTSTCFWVLQFKAAVAVHSSWCGDMFPWDKSNNLVWKLLQIRTKDKTVNAVPVNATTIV